MFFFINYLRAIATLLITNSHYGQIWPISDLAAGGLLGNILFFAASGFCLFNIKENFGKWYLKRIFRIYPVMAVFTLLTVLIGDYSLNSGNDAIRLFLYPTNYIFLVWLMLAYIAFYMVARISQKHEKFIEFTLAIVVCCWMLVYFIFVDKTIYHIDNVSDPFILFLYFASMLMGALFRKNHMKQKQGKAKLWLTLTLLPISLIVYFGSKIAFSKIQGIAFWQILNQISILAVLYLIFVLFISLEEKLGALPSWLNKSVGFVSGMTLHVYIVQFVVIRRFEHLEFPVNFILVTLGILLLAIAVYYADFFIRKVIAKLLDAAKKGNEKCRE